MFFGVTVFWGIFNLIGAAVCSSSVRLLLVSKDCPPVFLTQSDSVCPTTNSTSSAFLLLSLHSRVGNTPSIPDHCVTLYAVCYIVSDSILPPMILAYEEHESRISITTWTDTQITTISRCDLWRICYVKNIVGFWKRTGFTSPFVSGVRLGFSLYPPK